MSRGQQGIGISAAGMYGLLTTGKPRADHLADRARASPATSELQIDTEEPARHRQERADRRGLAARHAGRDRAGRLVQQGPPERRRVHGADGHRQPARAVRLQAPGGRDVHLRAGGGAVAAAAAGDQAAPVRRRAGHADQDAEGDAGEAAELVPAGELLPREPGGGRGDLQARQAQRVGKAAGPRAPQAEKLYKAMQQTKIMAPPTDCLAPDRGQADPGRPAEGREGRVLHRHHAPAGGLSRQPVPDRGGPGLRRAVVGRRQRQGAAVRQPRAAALPAERVLDLQGGG